VTQLSDVGQLAGGVPAGVTTGPEPAARRRLGVVARALFLLTKPRIVELLLVTTVPAMFLAERGVPGIRLLVVTLVGGSLAAGCANTLNCYLDRDIDAVMARTKRRPLVAPVTGEASGSSRSALHGEGPKIGTAVRPGEALVFGAALGVAATLLLGLLANWLAAVLADSAIVFYVAVYTIGLKRRTPSNIVIGGAAGCFPVLVGWAAVRGTVGWPAIVLFAVIFLWTPPHFWALAMKFKDDYAAAGVPMLPVVAPPAVVARKIVKYSWLMVAATLALAPYAGPIYAGCALALGGWFLLEAHRLRAAVADGGKSAPMRLFHLSIAYLTLLFAAVAVAALLPWHAW
jgi:heme o synthase